MSQPTISPLDSTGHQQMDEESRDILCPCSGTTRAQIRRHFARGTTDLDGISRATGACSGCGGCEYDVQDWLDKLTKAKTEAETVESTTNAPAPVSPAPTIHPEENSP